jgi:GDPmannose 4,6-dehydratase
MGMKKIVLITGITGQDGSYLAEFLLKKNYVVHGIKRKSSSFNTQRIDHIYVDPHFKTNFFLHYADLTDSNSIFKIISEIRPHEIYNLGAQSHVGVSFENPEYTAQVTGLGALRILEALRFLKLNKTKFYQAGSSELFGEINKRKIFNENSAFYPKSPYGASKLFAHQITKIYRDSYKIFACNGILFNHESPRRGETFVTRKITRFLTRWIYNLDKVLYLGNIYAIRDWGHAKDYVEMQWKILQQKNPDDYVIATGAICSVKEFVNKCCNLLKIKIFWSGKKFNEHAYVIKKNKKVILIKVDKNYFRPLEVDYLKGDSSKAFKKLKFKPKHDLNSLIKDMIDSDLILAQKESKLKNY